MRDRLTDKDRGRMGTRGERDRQADERQTDKTEGEWEQEGRDRQTG